MNELADLIDDAAAAQPGPEPTGRAKAARARPRQRSESRITHQAAFVLHSYPYKETSLIVDALTREHGRVALIARGAKRPRSALRGLLLAFQPLAIGWLTGRARPVSGAHAGGELRTLTQAEWIGGMRPLRGEALMSGFYLNELMQKLLARDDPHERLFDAYVEALGRLSGDGPAAPVLRQFEVELLREAGYAVRLAQAIDGEPIDTRAHYRYLPDQGPTRLGTQEPSSTWGESDAIVSGKTLLDIEAGDQADPVTQSESKLLMRHLLAHHLAGQMLNTRRVALDLQTLDQGAGR